MELKVRLCVSLLLAMGLCCLCLASPDTFQAPEPIGEHFFAETFGKGTLDSWVISSAKKEGVDEDIARYDGKWEVEEMKHGKFPGDEGLVLKSPSKHHAISAPFPTPFIFDTQPLIVQYEVNFQTRTDCGGAYLKLLTQSPDLDLKLFADTTPYTIMFGPDKCGEDYKLHFIFRHKNPRTGEFEEKRAKKPDVELKPYFTDKRTHLYTLVLKPDNSFEISVDQVVVNSGNLLSDMTPPVNPPAEIKDPDDHEPKDQGERTKIQKPNVAKADDSSEDAPTQVPGADEVSGDNTPSVRGEDSTDKSDVEDEMEEDEDEDDESGDRMDRPRVGDMDDGDDDDMDDESEARKIPNPDFFEDLHPFRMSPIGAVGLELWSTSSDIFFDNFLITSDRSTAERFANDGWQSKREAEGDAEEDEDEAEDDAGEEDVVQAEEEAEEPLDLQILSSVYDFPWTIVLYVAVSVALAIVLIGLFHYKKTTTTTKEKKIYDGDGGEEEDSEGSDDENEGVRRSTRRRRKFKKISPQR